MPFTRRDFVKFASLSIAAAGCQTTSQSPTSRATSLSAPLVPRSDFARNLVAEKAFPELKIYDSNGYPWRQPIEDWAGAKSRVAGDAAWQSWLQKEQQEVDTWITKFPIDKVEWSSGYSHYFVSPKDGSVLTWTPEIPGDDTDHFYSSSDRYVEFTDTLTKAWVSFFRAYHVGMMPRAASLYRLTRDRRYAEWVIDQFDLYSRYYYDWAGTNLGAHLRWEPLAEAELIPSYVSALRYLGDVVTPEQRGRWKKGLFDAMLISINRIHQDIHNIALWCRSAAGSVALSFGDEALWQWAINSEYGVRAQFAQGVNSDYLWKEQTYGYHNYTVMAALTLFQEAALHGRIGDIAPEAAICGDMMLLYTYLRYPNGKVHYHGDIAPWAMSLTPDVNLFRSAYRVFPTTVGLAEAAKTHDISTLLDPPQNTPSTVVLPEVTTRNLEASRMAVLRSGEWQLFFHYGQLTSSKSQSEALNYSVGYGMEDISHDTGAGNHDSPLSRWYYEPLCHNVPLIDGRGQRNANKGELLDFSPDIPRISAAQAYGEGRAERTLEIIDNKIVDTVIVDAKTIDNVPLGLALHFCGRVKLPKTFKPTKETPRKIQNGFSYFKDTSSAVFTGKVQFHIVYDSVTIRVTIETPGNFCVWHGTTPDQPVVSSGQRESIYLETDGIKAMFTTTWSVV